MPALVIIGILVGAYLAGKALRPKATLSIDAQEALAPAPYSDQGTDDELTPDDLTSPFIVLDKPETDGTAPNIIWNLNSDPAQQHKTKHPFNDPRRKPPRNRESKGPAEMRIGTANIKNFPDMTPAQVRADAHTVGQHCTIWGGQEIAPNDDDLSQCMAGLGANWDQVGGNHHEVPIFFRSDIFEQTDEFIIPFHRPSILHKQNAHGGVVSAAFRTKKHGHEFAVVNSHLVHSVDTNPNPALHEEWHKEWEMYGSAVRHYFTKGISVFGTGDLNHHMPRPVFKGWKWLTSQHAIDHIGFIQADYGSKFKPVGNPLGAVINLNSDHNLRFVRGKLS